MLGTVKDQLMIGGGVLESGFADTAAYSRSAPQGDQTYVVTPFGATGNFFRDDKAWSDRQEWLVNGFVRPIRWHGSHQIEVGADVERSDLDQTIFRHEFTVGASRQLHGAEHSVRRQPAAVPDQRRSL